MPAPDRGFAERVLAIVEGIPAGQVMTYGDVAAALGSRGARAVGQVMAYYGQSSPWSRVLRAHGHPPRGLEAEALVAYRAEGTPVLTCQSEAGYGVDYAACRFRPWSEPANR